MVTDSFAGNLQSMIDRCGSDVTYQPFVATGVDPLTNQPDDEDSCYPVNLRKTFKAQIELSPSQSLRIKLGLSENVAAVITVTKLDLDRLAIILTTKDRFTLPGYTDPFYIDKIMPTMQSRNIFHAYYVSLTRTAGGNRNR